MGFLIPVILYITYIHKTETIFCCYLAMIPSCYLLLSTCQEALLHFLRLDLDQLQAEQSTTTITLRTCRLGLKQMLTLFHTITKFKEGNENTVNKTNSLWIHVDFIPCKLQKWPLFFFSCFVYSLLFCFAKLIMMVCCLNNVSFLSGLLVGWETDRYCLID